MLRLSWLTCTLWGQFHKFAYTPMDITMYYTTDQLLSILLSLVYFVSELFFFMQSVAFQSFTRALLVMRNDF